MMSNLNITMFGLIDDELFAFGIQEAEMVFD